MSSRISAALLLAFSTVALLALLALRTGEPPSAVARDETMAIAQRYADHEWTPSVSNVFHGPDREGVRVNTPNLEYQPAEGRGGWWRIGGPNIGIPYMWGGFDTPETFDAALCEGKAAGDVGTAEKRRLLDDAVSRHAAGIDCSGFVSRCWKLPRSFSTREIAALCDPIADPADMRPGDIFNRHNAHVLLFAGWGDPERTHFTAYEATNDPEWKVVLSSRLVSFVLDEGFTAWRYRGMREEPFSAGQQRTARVVTPEPGR